MEKQFTAKLITIQGSARGGKGVLTRSLTDDLSKDYSIQAIDQGLKFRVLASLAIKNAVDIEDLEALAVFVSDQSTYEALLAELKRAYTLDKAALDAEFYTLQINNASGMVGKLNPSHDVVIAVLLEEVRRLAVDTEIIIIDGRTLQKYGKQLALEGAVDYILAIDVVCSPLTAAKRLMGLPSNAEIESLTSDQKTTLLNLINDIDRRNSSDARRARDPSLPIQQAYEYNVLLDWHDEALAQAAAEVMKPRAISVDNSFTRTKEQLADPVVALVRKMLS
jgi:cytidylate kinase